MTGKKVSELSSLASNTLNDTDLIPVVDTSAVQSKHVTVAALGDYLPTRPIPYFTMKSATKFWKVMVNDEGDFVTELIP